MKRIIISITIVLISFNLPCQETKSTFGLVIQPTLSSLYGVDYLDDYSNRISFSGGLEFKHDFNKHFSLKTGIIYDRKGAKSEINLSNASGAYIGETMLKMNYDYFTIPLLISIGTTGKTKVFINMGPSFSYLISQKYIIGGVGDIPKLTEDNSSNTKVYDFGFVTGVGFETLLSDKMIFGIEIRNNLGLVNTNKVDNDQIKTDIIGLLIGLRFYL